MRDTDQKFSRLTITLHWLVGITIMVLIGVGIYMTNNKVYSLYPTHKSIGILIFSLVLVRVVWRLMNGFPKPVGNYSSVEHILAKVVHWVLLIGTIMFPISGMMMSGAGGHGLYVFGVELLASNYNAAGEAVALNAELAEKAHNMHGILPKVMIVAIVLHVAGALKHHIIDKDGTLRRMLGKHV